MSLKAIITKQEFEAIGDGVREHYSLNEASGNYFLGVTAVDGWALEDVKGLRSALVKTRGERDAVEKKHKEFSAAFDGVDAEKAREALAKYEDIKSWDSDKKAAEIEKQFSDKFKTLGEKQAKELKAKDDLLAKRIAQIEDLTLTSEALKAISKHKGRAKVLLPHIKGAVRFKEENGSLIPEIIDATGMPRLSSAAGSTRSMTIEELVAEMKQDSDFSGSFDADDVSGTGAPASRPGGASRNIILSGDDAKNPIKYKAAKAAADKAGVSVELKP